jgi:hypothetical protein
MEHEKIERKRRVWQTLNIGETEGKPPIIHTFARAQGVENGTTVSAANYFIKPNAAGQYVLESNAPEYERQYAAMVIMSETYGLREVDPKAEAHFLANPPRKKSKEEVLAMQNKEQAEEIEKLKAELAKRK